MRTILARMLCVVLTWCAAMVGPASRGADRAGRILPSPPRKLRAPRGTFLPRSRRSQIISRIGSAIRNGRGCCWRSIHPARRDLADRPRARAGLALEVHHPRTTASAGGEPVGYRAQHQGAAQIHGRPPARGDLSQHRRTQFSTSCRTLPSDVFVCRPPIALGLFASRATISRRASPFCRRAKSR